MDEVLKAINAAGKDMELGAYIDFLEGLRDEIDVMIEAANASRVRQERAAEQPYRGAQ